MSDELKPIQTRYNGYHFRSRVEARWAVFFDALGVKYEYEPEGFSLRSGEWYLPDFRISNFCEQSGYFEVKSEPGVDKSAVEKLEFLREMTGKDVFLLNGPPDFKYYRMFTVPDPGVVDQKQEAIWYSVAFHKVNAQFPEWVEMDTVFLLEPKNEYVPEKLIKTFFSKEYITAVHKSRSARF